MDLLQDLKNFGNTFHHGLENMVINGVKGFTRSIKAGLYSFPESVRGRTIFSEDVFRIYGVRPLEQNIMSLASTLSEMPHLFLPVTLSHKLLRCSFQF